MNFLDLWKIKRNYQRYLEIKNYFYFNEKAASSWLVSVSKSYLLIWVNKTFYKYEKIKYKKTLVTLSHLTWIPLYILKNVFLMVILYFLK